MGRPHGSRATAPRWSFVGLVTLLSCAGGFAQSEYCSEGISIFTRDGTCDDENNNAGCGYDEGDCCLCSVTGSDYSRCEDPDVRDCDDLVDEYPDCADGNLVLIGDGLCDRINNIPECGYDGGDCCSCTCEDGPYHSCDGQTFYCADPSAPCVDPLLAEYPNCTGNAAYIGDGYCDMVAFDNNVESCDYDGGDCCACTCVDGPHHACGSYRGFLYCSDPYCLGLIADEYPNCTDGVLARIGNGRCESYNNNARCGYDGGDCCPCTCRNGNFLKCGMAGFECLDPDAPDDFYDCEEPPEVLPCSADDESHWVVEDDEDARALTGAVSCSGGVFHVDWRGHVSLNASLYVSDGTVLNISGTGASPAITGNSSNRLFTVVNASLRLSNLTVRDGYAMSGGAVASRSSSMTFDHTTFVGNEAYRGYGGALYLASDTRLSLTGLAIFADNVVHLDAASETFFSTWGLGEGGAIYLTSRSSVSWSGETSFINNWAYGVAGAVMLTDDSHAAWSGTTTFVRNFGYMAGGAVLVSTGSSVTWNADTSFVENQGALGGAMTVWGSSNVSWSARTSFRDNIAYNGGGGALYLTHDVNVTWTENTSFVGNYAAGDGGAVFVGEDVSIDWSAPTNFTSNVALNGGAIGSGERELDSEAEYSHLAVGAPTVFVDNRCEASGGALSVGGLLRLGSLSNTSFVGNVANVSGGAVFISGVLYNLVIVDVIFDSNVAELGGAVYVVGSQTTFTSCTFIHNLARASGGAIESIAGQDIFEFSLFKGNKARVGGALRLAGTIGLQYCTFEDNVSDEGGGAAVSNVGFFHDVYGLTFVENVFNCVPGTFLDFVEADEVFSKVCDGCGSCPNCHLEQQPNPQCTPAMDNTHSRGGNVTIEEVEVHRGYWRATNTSRVILACYNTDACRGGISGSPRYCRGGYQGPYCSVCREGFAAYQGFVCTKCSSRELSIVAAAVFAVLAVTVGAAVVWYLLSGDPAGTGRSVIDLVKRYVPLHSVKIIIVVWQITTQFAAVSYVTFPGPYERFLDVIEVLNFDFNYVLSTGCFLDIDFHDRLLVATMAPIVVLLILGLTYFSALRRHRGSEDRLGVIRHKHISMVLLVTFLVYAPVSSILFQMFACEHLDDGRYYLRADYRIECDSPEHVGLEIYSGLMILFYTLGIPALYAYLLRRFSVGPAGKGEGERSAGGEAISDLWKPYRSERYYFEVIECARRVLLTSVLVIIFPNSGAQIAVAIMITLFFLLVTESLAPYASQWDTWLSRMGHVNVFTSMYIALLLKVDVTGERAPSQVVFAGVMIIAQLCMVVVVAIEAGILVGSVRSIELEAPKPRFRPGKMAFHRSRASSLIEVDDSFSDTGIHGDPSSSAESSRKGARVVWDDSPGS